MTPTPHIAATTMPRPVRSREDAGSGRGADSAEARQARPAPLASVPPPGRREDYLGGAPNAVRADSSRRRWCDPCKGATKQNRPAVLFDNNGVGYCLQCANHYGVTIQ